MAHAVDAEPAATRAGDQGPADGGRRLPEEPAHHASQRRRHADRIRGQQGRGRTAAVRAHAAGSEVMHVLQQRAARHTWGVRAAWLLLALAATLYCVWRFASSSPLQTNLLALLPATEADPVAEKAVDTLATALGDRTVFLVTANDAAHAKAAAKQLGATLSKSGAFGSVIAELPPFDTTQIARLYLPYRFNLLAPQDRAALADGSVSLGDSLAQRLYSPMQCRPSTPLASHPFSRPP